MLTAMAPASAAVSHCRGAVSTLHFVTDYKCIRWGQGASHKVKRLIQCLEKHKATFEQVWLSQLMHMSSACPRDRPLGLPGRYVGEYKGMEWFLCPWAGGNSTDCFRINEWGNSHHCWIRWLATTGTSREYLPPARREKTQPGHLKKSGVHSIMKSRNLTRGLCLTKLPLPWGEIFNFAACILQFPWYRPGGRPPEASRWHVHNLVSSYMKLFMPCKYACGYVRWRSTLVYVKFLVHMGTVYASPQNLARLPLMITLHEEMTRCSEPGQEAAERSSVLWLQKVNGPMNSPRTTQAYAHLPFLRRLADWFSRIPSAILSTLWFWSPLAVRTCGLGPRYIIRDWNSTRHFLHGWNKRFDRFPQIVQDRQKVFFFSLVLYFLSIFPPIKPPPPPPPPSLPPHLTGSSYP